MPLTKKGRKIKARMIAYYTGQGKTEQEAESIFYASENAGTIQGVAKHEKKKHDKKKVRARAREKDR